MLIQQYIDDFNNQIGDIKFLSYTDEIVLSNKLKLIQCQFTDVDLKDVEVCDFFSNLYHLLCQSSSMKSELLESCLDIILVSINSRNTRLQSAMKTDFRFLPVLIEEIVSINEDDKKLIKLLSIIRELLNYSSELDEHNLKMLLEAFRDHIASNENREIKKICLHILADLCLNNHAAKYLITKTLKSTDLKKGIEDLDDTLVSFKFFILLEDEVAPTDVKYFIDMSLKDIRASLATFSMDSINHSLDIFKHFAKLETHIDFKISDEEKLSKMLSDLIDDLLEKLPAAHSEAKENFFEAIFEFFNMLLHLDSELVKLFESFTESSFLAPSVSRSTEALKFFATYIKSGGSLKAAEIVIESLMEYFIGNPQDPETKLIDYEQKYAFLQLLNPLVAEEKLSEIHLDTISTYFNSLVMSFKRADTSMIADEEIFLFIHFLSSLSNIGRKNATSASFYAMLSEVLKLDFLPVFIAKAHLSRKEEILTILFELASVENFPNKKVAAILSRNGTRAEENSSRALQKSLTRSDVQSKSSRIIRSKLSEEIEVLVNRINANLDNNERTKMSDLVTIYRLKVNVLNDHLSAVTSSLDQSTKEISELRQKIASFKNVSEKQEFFNWCLALDNERMIKEVQTVNNVMTSLKDSLTMFQSKVNREEAAKNESQRSLKIKMKEIEKIKSEKLQAEQKLHEVKVKLQLTQKENDDRINELKESLEIEKKSKGEELAEAIAEQKKMNQKITSSEKEIQKLLELIKLHEKELVQKQEKIQQYETELKEGEQMKSTIMSLMQARSFKNK